MAEATTRSIARYRATSNSSEIISVIRNTIALYIMVALIAGLIIYYSAGQVIQSTFNLSASLGPSSDNLFRVTAFVFSARLLHGLGEAILRGFERYDIESRISMFLGALAASISCITVTFTNNLTYIMYGIAGSAFLGLILITTACVRLTGESRLLLPRFEWKRIREILQFSVFNWINAISGIALNQADRFIIGATLGTTSLGYYSICLQITQTAYGLLSKSLALLLPGASRLDQAGDFGGLRRLFAKGMLANTIAGCIMSLAFFLFANGILGLWMGSEFRERATGILMILAFANALQSTSVTPSLFLNGAGHFRLNALFGVASGTLVLTAAVFLIPHFGLVGASVARLCNLPLVLLSRSIFSTLVLKLKRPLSGFVQVSPILSSFLVALPIVLLRPATNITWSYFAFASALFILSSFVCIVASGRAYRFSRSAPVSVLADRP